MKHRFFPVLSLIIFLGLAPFHGGQAQTERSSLPYLDPWQPVAGPYGGSIAAVALSPNYAVDHIGFAGLRADGVYRTTTSGDSWHSVSPAEWPVIDLAVSPTFADDQTLFVTAGLWTTGYDVYRSADEGSSWQDVTPAWGALANPPGLAISPDFVSDGTLYVLGGQTYLSTDGGDTFIQAGGWFTSHFVIELAFSPAFANDLTLFALVPAEGLYKSTDGGATWNPTGLSGDYSTFALSPDYADDQMLLAVTASDGLLHLSTDGGDSWAPGTLVLAPAGHHTLHFSPTFADDRVILAASSADPGAFRSEDGGATWTPVGWYDPDYPYQGGFVGGRVFALALAPNDAWDAIAFAGTSSGIYRSLDRGVHWYQRNTGLSPLTVRTLALAPDDPDTMLAGTSFFEHLRFDTAVPAEYDGNLQLSLDGGQTWRDVSGRLERLQNVVFSPGFSVDQTAFAAAGTLGEHGYFDGGVYRSTDGGQNWDEVLADRICKALALSPNFAADQTLWVSTSTDSEAEGISRSTDGGDTWTPLAPDVQAQIIVPSPNYALDQTLFAGTQDAGLQRSTNGGLTWTGVLTYATTALAVSPVFGASRTLYAGVKEDPLAPGDIYRSTDGGNSWQRLDTGIPDTWPVPGRVEPESNSLTISTLAFAYDGSVLAGIYYGSENDGGAVYRAVDGAETWQAVGSGLDAFNVFALATIPRSSLTFYAGTDGGLWALDVSQGGPAEPGTWESNGPRGGRAQALAVSPALSSDGVAFTGGWTQHKDGGQSGLGIFKSTDAGQNWTWSASGTEEIMYGSAVHDFAFSPGFVTDGIVFAATWGGLFRSTDGGQTWLWASRLYSGPPGSITAVAVAPDFPASGHVLAASGWGGLHMSQDGGINWTAYYTVPASSGLAYSPEFATDGMAFAGAWNGLWRTSDRGTSWTQTLTATAVSDLVVSPQFGADGTLFVGGDALYISHDAGTSWISVTLPTDPYLVDVLAISPDFGGDQTLFAGIVDGLYRSTDGGLSWEAVAGFPGLAVRSLAISPGWPAHPVMLAGTDQGVYWTADGGTMWTLAPGLTTLSTEPLALSAGEELLVTGAYRHGIYASQDGGASWFPMGLQELGSGTTRSLAISPSYASDGTILAASISLESIGASIYRTVDRGATWENVFGTGYVGDLAISPQFGADGTVFTAAEGLVLWSEDGGASWSPLGDWPPAWPDPARLVALPPNYPSDDTVFAAGDGFWRLPPGESTWEVAASGLLTDTYVLSIAVSPRFVVDSTLLALAYWQGGAPGEVHYGVFRSTDGGVNWNLANTGLPDAPLEHITFSPRYAWDRTVYLTSRDILYRSLDGGLSWTAVRTAQGSSVLHELVVDSSGKVYVASGTEYVPAGEGVWRYSTPAQDIVVDGGFEAESGWELPSEPVPAGYSDQTVYEGAHSMRIGIVNDGNELSYSSARQVVTIPADAISATLRCHAYPVSGDAAKAAQEQTFSEGMVPMDGDAQYLLLLDPDTGATLGTLFWELSNAQSWQARAFDLTAYAGQPLKLHFGVYNDGAGGWTGMYVDNVSLVVQRPPQPEVTHWLYLPLGLKNHE